MKRSDELKAAIDELRKRGAVNITPGQGGKHPRIYFEYQGRKRFVVISGTPSSQSASQNIREHVRRALGVVRSKKVGERRSRKHRIDDRQVEPPAKITPGRDPFADIAGTPIYQAALCIEADRLWHRYFGALLRLNGHQPITERMR